MESNQDDDTEAGPSFETAHKAKLSITSILNTSHERSGNRVLDSTEILNTEDIPPETEENPQHFSNRCCSNRPLLGIIFAVLSAVTFSFSALLGKLVSHLNSFNVGLWTFLLMTLFATVLIIFHYIKSSSSEEEESIVSIFRTRGESENRIPTKIYLFLLLRSVCGVSALLFFFYSVKYIPVGDVIVIDASSPIFVCIMAFLFLGEKFGYLVILTTILAFSGVTLIARPSLLSNKGEYDSNSLVGAILAFSAMFCIVMSVITLKFLEGVHYSIVNFAFSFWGILQCTLVAWIMGALSVPSDPWDIFKIFSIALVFYLGQAFLTLALKYQDAGPVGLLRTTEVVFIFIWQWIFIGVVPDIYTWCGGALILLGSLLTILRNWINTLEETHSVRIKCRCLLW